MVIEHLKCYLNVIFKIQVKCVSHICVVCIYIWDVFVLHIYCVFVYILGIDVYAAGLMLASMLTHSHSFFQPECDEHHLLQMIGVYGIKTVLDGARALYRKLDIFHSGSNNNAQLLETMKQNDSKCDGNLSTIVKLRRKCIQNHSFATHLPIGVPSETDEQMLDFLDQITLFNFGRRLTSAQALQHPFLILPKI